VIPQGYGAGTVLLWDRGTWEPQGDPQAGLERGSLKFRLDGERLQGGFVLVRMKPKGKEKQENWLLIKQRDEHADGRRDPTKHWTESVKSGRTLPAISREAHGLRHPGSGVGDPGLATDYGPPTTDSRSSQSKRRARQRLKFVKPELATLRPAPPAGSEWLHEIKHDGYRLQALIAGGDVRLITRNEQDWTSRYASIAAALEQVDANEAILDGELVALDAAGHSDFGALQNASAASDLLYYAFDLLALDGEDLRSKPLRERKQRLHELIPGDLESVRYSDHIEGPGDEVLARACRMGFEGIISKRAMAPYRSGRGTDWIKSKCVGRDEFVIGGYRKSDKHGRPFASLLLGEYADGKLEYRGRVGTGFDDAVFKDLARRLASLRRASPPFADLPSTARRGAEWVEPQLVAQIAYAERTGDGLLRHPSFQGLREDKSAREVRMPEMARNSADGDDRLLGVRLTSPDKVLYRELGLKKRDLAQYYLDVAPQMLPHLAGRPVSLVRCPAGRSGKCFFQKHFNESTPEHLKCVEIAEKNGAKKSYLTIDDAAGLVAAAQMGALELHVWGASADRIERPERIVFDLDPGEGVTFADVCSAARELRELLDETGLKSYALLTGGKGVHVIAPIVRRTAWAEVKSFARGTAERLAAAAPQRFLTTASKAARKGRIFIDWLRNERGATAVVPFSVRARAGAPVAVPVTWNELPGIETAAQFDVHGVRSRIARLGTDPWKDYFEVRQSLTKSMLRGASAS